MRNTRLPKSDLRRLVTNGAVLMAIAYLLDSIVNASVGGGSIIRQLFSPGSREVAVRLGFLSVFLLFMLYALGILDKRRRMEKALEKYEAGMDASIDGIFILDRKMLCSYANNSLATLYGFDSYAELLGKSWRLFFGDEEIPRFEETVFPRVFEKREWRSEAIGRRRDGSLFPLEVSITVIDDGGVVGIVRDITELKDAEKELESKAEELEAANREMEAFGYSLTHDMRTYLTRIYSAAQMLRHDHAAALGETGRYLVDVVCDTNKEMQELITDMMVLSRIVRSEIMSEEVDLSEMARGVAAALQLAGLDRRVEFVIAPDLIAQCDPHLIKIVIDNLLGNAWKYTGTVSEPHVEFGSTVIHGQKAFYVRDNGIGFDMSETENLFKPFQRLQNAKGFAGTGIGLATVCRAIQRHGGNVWGEGTPGKGATFFFTLPG